MVRIVTVDRTKACALCSSFDGAQSDPSRLGGEAGQGGAGGGLAPQGQGVGKGCRLLLLVGG